MYASQVFGEIQSFLNEHVSKYKLFFGLDELEESCWVLEKCTSAPETFRHFWIILVHYTSIFVFLQPERGF